LKLDVGCGNNPRGDINVDLFIEETSHRPKQHALNPQKIPIFVKADIHKLPFREGIFNQCWCSHVIEHRGVRVIEAIREMQRITNGVITIVVPHRIHERKHWSIHNKIFNVSSLDALLKRMNVDVFYIETIYECLPHPFLCILRLPREIKIEILNYN